MLKVAIARYTNGDAFIVGVKPEDIVVHLDNGHGTRVYTIGKCSADGRYYEGEWSRMMVPKIASALKEFGFGVNIVVPEDRDIPLLERCRRANDYMAKHPDKYHIFLSVHTNATPKEQCVNGWNDTNTGLCVYVARNASESSKVLARNVYDAGAAMGLKGNRSVPSQHYWQAGFTVISDTKMPAILTESAFHNNHNDVDWLLSEAGQETVVNYHVAGICKTFGIPYSLCVA